MHGARNLELKEVFAVNVSVLPLYYKHVLPLGGAGRQQVVLFLLCDEIVAAQQQCLFA